LVGEKTGFAYADEISLAAIKKAAETARGISSKPAGNRSIRAFSASSVTPLYASNSPLHSLTEIQKIQLLQDIDREVRRIEPRVKQVSASLAGSLSYVLVAASDGTYAADIRPIVRLSVSVIVESNGRREQGSAGVGGRRDYQYFLKEDLWKNYAAEAVRQACVALEAKPTPAGTMDVVLGSGWPGILLHEAVGHGLEGDFNRKGVSSFSGRVGTPVASKVCTIVDDGTLPHRRGSLTIDDEGTPTQKTVLIENGILKGYMQDKLNARLMKVAPTGNGRRQSYAHLPMPRMTNTYMLPGEYAQEEIIASIKKGLYAVNFSGGQVDITSGKFVFVCNEAYWIENGKVMYPVKDATLIGHGPAALHQVTMVGNDLALDPGIGVCGKDGQSVAVGVGMPTIRINQMTSKMPDN
ncbi:MAG: metalloprotease TldD, partial [Gammaproteobacteria bacterium]|nr:metalloprotease TldD [Gammaproteobacteria bacterium]